MKILVAVLLSAAFIWLYGGTSPAHINNSVTKAVTITQPTGQVRSTATAPAVTVSVATTPAPPEPTPVTEPETKPQGCDSYRDLFSEYNWNVNTAIAVCKAESGGRTDIVSATHDYGLMQISHVHRDMVHGDLTKLFDPNTNIRIAYSLYSANGWQPWSAYKNGSYLRFL